MQFRLGSARARRIAEEHGVPIVEDPPLARALFKMVPLGADIPEDMYRAVAEVLAYVYRLEKSKKRVAEIVA